VVNDPDHPDATGQASDETALTRVIAELSGADSVNLLDQRRLGGGAVQDNQLLTLHCIGGSLGGVTELVLRRDAPSQLPMSLGRAEEFAVLQLAHRAGVAVPEPLWLLEPDALGPGSSQCYLMRRVSGKAEARALVRGAFDARQRRALLHALGATLARLHAITPPRAELPFLTLPEPGTARQRVAALRHLLDGIPQPQPTLEWALRWLDRNAPDDRTPVLCHGDFRTGNYLVDEQGQLQAVLDWEFAHWGDAREDFGWFCARFWRFGATGQTAGGIGAVEDLLDGYRDAGGDPPASAELGYWQVLADVRWAVIALLQAERHRSGRQPSLELALTAELMPEIELGVVEGIREQLAA
jgi:aminoglycoside phosphotransferase (APT) family kinase protein